MEFSGRSIESLVESGPLVVDPPIAVLPRLLTHIESNGVSSPVRLALSPAVADTVSERFLIESRVAGAVARDELRVRETGGRCTDRAILGAADAAVVVSVDERVEALPVSDESVVTELHERYASVWDAAEPFSARAPPRRLLFETHADTLPEAFTSQLERAIEHASRLEWHGSPTPVELALTVGARTGTHHYDLCVWAEAAAFTSRSTAARTKQRLEEEGLLGVEPVPQERGRPRQRLLVADEALAAPDAETLVPALRRLTA